MTDEELPQRVRENRQWDARADQWVALGERGFRAAPSWGCWEVPESELGLLPLACSA